MILQPAALFGFDFFEPLPIRIEVASSAPLPGTVRPWQRSAPEGDAAPGAGSVSATGGFVRMSASLASSTPAPSCRCYSKAEQLLILADGGGGNGNRARAWKWNLQRMLCDRFGLTVTVCHYPPGCSKWNPVEHRLFSQISINWQGKPLRSLAIMLNYIRGTTTTTGLTVTAYLDDGIYPRGQKVTREEMAQLNLEPHTICPDWNYTLRPTQLCSRVPALPSSQTTAGTKNGRLGFTPSRPLFRGHLYDTTLGTEGSRTRREARQLGFSGTALARLFQAGKTELSGFPTAGLKQPSLRRRTIQTLGWRNANLVQSTTARPGPTERRLFYRASPGDASGATTTAGMSASSPPGRGKLAGSPRHHRGVAGAPAEGTLGR
jgi:hypothetical protein